jgi:hypothetical protein
MSWIEIRKIIGDKLPEFMDEKHGYPTPDKPDFWMIIYQQDEIQDFIRDQLRKRVETNPDAKDVFKAIVLLNENIPPEKLTDERVQESLNTQNLVVLFFWGPARSYFRGLLGITETGQRTNDYLTQLEEHKNEVSSMNQAQKDFLWWSVFLDTSNDNGEDIKLDEAVKKLTNMGVEPPEVL